MSIFVRICSTNKKPHKNMWFFVCIKFRLNTLFRRLATLPSIRVPSPQRGLTSGFGMRTGVTPATNHQNKIFNSSSRRSSFRATADIFENCSVSTKARVALGKRCLPYPHLQSYFINEHDPCGSTW